MESETSSILWTAGAGSSERVEAPDYFTDLHLVSVVEELVDGRDVYALAPLFWTPLRDAAAITWRQEVFEDLRREETATCVRHFATAMGEVRARLERSEKLRHPLQARRWALDASGAYVEAVTRFAQELRPLRLESSALRAFRDRLARYASSQELTELARDVADVGRRLDDVRYTTQVLGTRVTVRQFAEEADYSREVLDTFERFRQGGRREPGRRPRSMPELDHVESSVLERVAELYPDTFAALREFVARHTGFLSPLVRTFDREAQFYLAYLDLIRRLDAAGLPFCQPELVQEPGAVHASATFDIALAAKLADGPTKVVVNDFALEDAERVIVVSGPNQGGKTTFARTFGQLHHLATLGCPVPGRGARLQIADAVFTHFEREERIDDPGGKLHADLTRMHEILARATSSSVVVMNEPFSSTSLEDARFLGQQVLERLIEIGSLGVYVTFVDELASLGQAVVSMVSTVDPDDPATRTFRLERRPPDGMAYAAILAERHGLTYEAITKRVAT